MLSFTGVKKGKTIVLDGDPYLVVSSNFMRKQATRPVMRSVLKNIKTGQTREHTFQQADKVDEADVQRASHQYLYSTGDSFTFMNQETYEQVELSDSLVGDMSGFLLEGEVVDVVMFDGTPIGLELPIKVERKVISAPPGVRGDTSTNVMKEVVIEGGTIVKAPLFIKEGDILRIDTRTGVYVERV